MDTSQPQHHVLTDSSAACGMVPATDYQIVFQPHLAWQTPTVELLLAGGAWYAASLALSYGQGALSWFARGVAGLAAVWALVTGLRASWEYFTLRHDLTSGAAGVVEGTIRDLHIPPLWEHTAESFTVQGVRFSYAPSEFTGAYNTPSTYGGLIHAGRQVRVHYLPGHHGYALSENLILEIEVPATPP